MTEPVAWQWLTTAHFRKKLPKDAEKGAWSPLYTHPQPKPLVGLTPEELSAIWDSMGTWNSTSAQHFYNAIWKAIKEKNSA